MTLAEALRQAGLRPAAPATACSWLATERAHDGRRREARAWLRQARHHAARGRTDRLTAHALDEARRRLA